LNLEEVMRIAMEISHDAGSLLDRHFSDAGLTVSAKGSRDVVTRADIESEALVKRRLEEEFPEHGVVGEEGTDTSDGKRYRWFVDPLDGTLNFSRGLPVWGVSVALAEENEVCYGAFFDPLHDELFYAQRGAGATVNGTLLRTSGVEELAQAVVNCAVAHGELAGLTGQNAQRMWDRVMRLRMNGSVGSALANIAAGRMDAAIELRGGPWDYAAGGLLVREAGGYTSTFEGGPLVAEATTVLAAATPALHRRLHALLSE
jgi:myo-inositol-1(or 4)-monophosphatase